MFWWTARCRPRFGPGSQSTEQAPRSLGPGPAASSRMPGDAGCERGAGGRSRWRPTSSRRRGCSSCRSTSRATRPRWGLPIGSRARCVHPCRAPVTVERGSFSTRATKEDERKLYECTGVAAYVPTYVHPCVCRSMHPRASVRIRPSMHPCAHACTHPCDHASMHTVSSDKSKVRLFKARVRNPRFTICLDPSM